MNPWAENIKCILPLLDYWSDMCERKETCVRQNKCQIGGPLQVVLEIPYRFPKAILIVIDTQALIYQYIDYIGFNESPDSKKGFTKGQYDAMLNHYEAKEGESGKARSINKDGLLYPVYETKEPKPFNFIKSPDSKIREAFQGEEAFAIPIPCGGEVLPVLIVFLKNSDQVMQLRNLLKERLREIQVIVKDTRKESLGKLVSAIPDGVTPGEDSRGKFSRWLLGWLEERDGLWLGNKLWFVVDHGLIHAKNLWKLANDLAKEHDLGKKLSDLYRENPLIFSLAIWLHDIGYRGIHIPSKMELMNVEIENIVKKHGKISAALMLNYKEPYNLSEFDDPMLKYVGLICAYHQSEYPISTKNNGNGSKSCSSITFEKIIYEEEKFPLENLSFDNVYSLRVMASLLRLLDSCDYNRNRVGSSPMIKLRENVCKDNALALEEKFKKLMGECLDMAKNKIKETEKNNNNLLISKLEEMINEVFIPQRKDDKKLKIFEELKKFFGNNDTLKDTDSLGKYIGYLNQQKQYYNVHNFVISTSFKKSKNENGFVDLEYEIDEKELAGKEFTKEDVEKEIKDFIHDKAMVVYEEILKSNILKIKRVEPFSENFDAWIKNEDDKQH